MTNQESPGPTIPQYEQVPGVSASLLIRELFGSSEANIDTLTFGKNLHAFVLEGRWGAQEPTIGDKARIANIAIALRSAGFNATDYPQRELWRLFWYDHPDGTAWRCKARIDALRSVDVEFDEHGLAKPHDWTANPHLGTVVDIKTTSRETEAEVRQAMTDYGYWMQAAWYIMGMHGSYVMRDPATGRTRRHPDHPAWPLSGYEMVFYFVQKTAPYKVFVIRCDEKTPEVVEQIHVIDGILARMRNNPDYDKYRKA